MADKPISLHLGLTKFPSTQGLYDGTIQPPGIELNLQSSFGVGLDKIGARHREIIAGNIDGGELSLSSFINARLRGIPLKALPVFPDRTFCHRFIYTAVNSPLRSPKELAGKKATVHRYNATAPVWTKGVLQNDYNVKLESIDWYVAEPNIGDESLRPLPPDVRINLISPPHTREHAIELVEQGEIDAALEPYASLETNPSLRHLEPDFRRAGADYFRRVGAVHIKHVIVLREEIVETHPWIPERLLEAFCQGLEMTDCYATESEKAEEKWKQEAMGEVFSYSLIRGCAWRSIEVLMEYQMQQGIIERPAKIDELFFPQVMNL